MNNSQEENCCPVMGKKHCVFKEMINDHPWLSAAVVFVVALLLGRHRCCRKKKQG